jgi:hypothetical protein
MVRQQAVAPPRFHPARRLQDHNNPRDCRTRDVEVHSYAVGTPHINGISARDAFPCWMGVICETFIHLDCASPITHGFSGRLYIQPFGEQTVSDLGNMYDRSALSPTGSQRSAHHNDRRRPPR